MQILGFIGARGGSKGLKGKNLMDLGGKPLIQWTIDAALASRLLSDVVVSTDDADIRDCALRCGARAPFLRPLELAADESDINDAVIHALDWLEKNEGRVYDLVALLQPTQPFRPEGFVDSVLRDFLATADVQQDTLVTVTHASSKVANLMHSDAAAPQFVSFALDIGVNRTNRQSLPTYYLPAGVLYVAPVKLYRRTLNFYGPRTRFVVVDERTAVDIDTPNDYKRAVELLNPEGV